jgi:hypothetical protein
MSRLWGSIILIWHIMLLLSFVYTEMDHSESAISIFFERNAYTIVLWLLILYFCYIFFINIHERPFTFSGIGPFISIPVSIGMMYAGASERDINKLAAGAFFFMSSLNIIVVMHKRLIGKKENSKKQDK